MSLTKKQINILPSKKPTTTTTTTTKAENLWADMKPLVEPLVGSLGCLEVLFLRIGLEALHAMYIISFGFASSFSYCSNAAADVRTVRL